MDTSHALGATVPINAEVLVIEHSLALVFHVDEPTVVTIVLTKSHLDEMTPTLMGSIVVLYSFSSAASKAFFSQHHLLARGAANCSHPRNIA